MGRGGEREDAQVMMKRQINDVTSVMKPRDGAGKRAETGPRFRAIVRLHIHRRDKRDRPRCLGRRLIMV